MKTEDKYIEGLAQIFKTVIPKQFFRDYKNPENRRTLFEVACNKACLSKTSFDVMRGFEKCFNQNFGKE